MAPHVRRALLVLALLPLACGGDDGPQYSLQSVMFEVQIQKLKLDEALLTPGADARVEEHAAAIRKWTHDPAADRYLERADLKGTPEQFRGKQKELDDTLDALLSELRGGNAQGAAALGPKLSARCDACHAIFRPDLPPTRAR